MRSRRVLSRIVSSPLREPSSAWLACAAALAFGCSSTGDAVSTSPALSASPAQEVPLSFGRITVRSEGGQARFEGAKLAGKPGQPALPVHTVRLLLAPDTDLRQVTATVQDAQETVLPGTYRVSAAEPPRTDKGVLWGRQGNIVDGKDMDVYGKDAFFPASNVLTQSTGQLHRFKLVEVAVSPYRWNPATGELRMISGGRLVVTAPADSSASSAVSGSAAMDQRYVVRLATLVDNFDKAIVAYQPASPISSSKLETSSGALTAGANGYAILTTTQPDAGQPQPTPTRARCMEVLIVATTTCTYALREGAPAENC